MGENIVAPTQKSKPKTRRFFVAAVFGVAVFGMPVIDVFATRGEIYPNVRIAGIEVGGKTVADAKIALSGHTEKYLAQTATFTLGALQASVPSSTFLSFDIDAAIKNAEAVGNSGTSLSHMRQRLQARVKGVEIPLVSFAQEEPLAQALKSSFGTAQTEANNANFAFSFEGDNPTITISPETSGAVIDITATESKITLQAASLTSAPIELTLSPASAEFTTADLTTILPKVEELFASPQPEIKKGDKQWKIPYATLATWITPQREEENIRLSFDQDQIIKWLDTIAKEVEQKASDAVFEVSPDGKRATKFDIGTAGIELPRKENAALIAKAILDTLPAELITKESRPSVTTAQGLTEYGIKELVGRGTTNFKGSPPNRIKNIKRGAALLQGILISPGQEFSLLDALRPFTLENGYLPELVIKAAEGRTTPEIGGGLCQIGTTMFRTALNAGLPITERRNHSYRVSYYEPPVGMDATIYDPAPDFKFLNDTGYWLVLTTNVDGNNLTFELWGTKDGRKVEITDPVISNIKSPPAKKIIETLDLPVGTTKCTERAHMGSDAKFTYTVTYSDGRTEVKEFFSRYRPWQEVCLVGVEKLSAPEVPPTEVPLSPDAAAPTNGTTSEPAEIPADTGVPPPSQN